MGYHFYGSFLSRLFFFGVSKIYLYSFIMRYFTFLLVLLLPVSLFAADNTELIQKEPTTTEPKFERKIFNSCSEFESMMSNILSKRTNSYYAR